MARVVMCVQNMPVPQDRRVWREAKSLRAAGHEVTVVSPGGSTMRRRERLDGIDIVRWPDPPELRGLAGQVAETASALAWTAWHLARLRLAGRVDVLHAANPPDTYFVLAAAMRPLGTRFVFDQHDLCPELLDVQQDHHGVNRRVLRLALRAFERCTYRCAHLVITPNNSYRRIALARGRVPPHAVVAVRSGPDELSMAPAPVGPPVVGFAGMMNVQDRVDLLLDAAAGVVRDHDSQLRLLLIGTGDDVPRLKERAAALGIADLVEWTGWLTGNDLRRELHRASIAVSLDGDNEFSRVSTMTKIPEYLALGIPCLVADLPENRVSAGDAARYFRPGDAADLARNLRDLLERPELLTELRSAAVERAPALVWEHSARRLLAAYDWLLDGGAPVEGDQHVADPRRVAAAPEQLRAS